MLEAVVVAVQALQEVQGAPELQVPEVHPVQASLGHALPSHHADQGPAVQAPDEPQGPQFPPNGPYPGPPPFDPHAADHGPPVQAELLVAVAAAEDSGAAVNVTPTSTQSCAMFAKTLALSEAEQLDPLIHELAFWIEAVSLQKQAPSPAQLLPVNVLMQEEAQEGQLPHPPPTPGPQGEANVPADEAKTRRETIVDFMMMVWSG